MRRYEDILMNVAMALATILLGGVLIMFIVLMFSGISSNDLSATNAHPIAQQKLGDDVNPDVLIIYEAEVDGETVYPSVIKEAE